MEYENCKSNKALPIIIGLAILIIVLYMFVIREHLTPVPGGRNIIYGVPVNTHPRKPNRFNLARGGVI